MGLTMKREFSHCGFLPCLCLIRPKPCSIHGVPGSGGHSVVVGLVNHTLLRGSLKSRCPAGLVRAPSPVSSNPGRAPPWWLAPSPLSPSISSFLALTLSSLMTDKVLHYRVCQSPGDLRICLSDLFPGMLRLLVWGTHSETQGVTSCMIRKSPLLGSKKTNVCDLTTQTP